MFVQGVENIFALDWNGLAPDAGGMTYADVYLQAEREFSAYNFELADTAVLFRHFEDAEKECRILLERPAPLTLPAYDQCMKASHLFNQLDARGVISATERQSYIGRVRALAKGLLRGLAGQSRPSGQGGLKPMAEFLLELLAEEIPARMQTRGAQDLKRLVCDKLGEMGLTFTRAESYATPRRLALWVDGLPKHQPDRLNEIKGPRVSAPVNVIESFLKARKIPSLDACEQRGSDKNASWFFVERVPGGPTGPVLAENPARRGAGHCLAQIHALGPMTAPPGFGHSITSWPSSMASWFFEVALGSPERPRRIASRRKPSGTAFWGHRASPCRISTPTRPAWACAR